MSMSPFTFRKDFRPAYTKLNLLGTFMPHTPILAMTATATAHYRNEIKRSLGMQNVLNVEANPDRENIFYEVHPLVSLPRDQETTGSGDENERDCKRFFYRRFVAKRGPCSQAFLMETVETGDKNRELYANESCDDHAVYFRR